MFFLKVKLVETSSKTALFNVSVPNPDIYLVVKVEKTLRGVELDSATDPYSRGQVRKKNKRFYLKNLI